jgi:tetratricopeptide (TPR) repeat protein
LTTWTILCVRSPRQQLRTVSSDDPALNQLKQQVDDALEAGEFGRAEELLNQASELDLKAGVQRLISAAASKARNGDLKNVQLAYAEAATYYCEAANILPSDADELQAGYLNYAGGALYDAGKYGDAEPLYQRALQIREQVLGPQHPDVAQGLNNLAELYHTQGKYEEAEPLYQRALKIREQALGPQHPDVAQSLNNLAALYHEQGKYEEAEPLYQRALKIFEQALGPDHPHSVTCRTNLAALRQVSP